jgi:hypothetical protein
MSGSQVVGQRGGAAVRDDRESRETTQDAASAQRSAARAVCARSFRMLSLLLMVFTGSGSRSGERIGPV